MLQIHCHPIGFNGDRHVRQSIDWDVLIDGQNIGLCLGHAIDDSRQDAGKMPGKFSTAKISVTGRPREDS
jgi:hypothetical protein